MPGCHPPGLNALVMRGGAHVAWLLRQVFLALFLDWLSPSADRFDKLVYVGINEDRESQLRVLSAITRK